VPGYGLDDRAIEVRSPAEARDFSSSLCVQICSGAHPDSCTKGTGDPFPGAKARPGRDADHSPHPVPRSLMSRSHTSSPAKFLRGVFWDSFSFLVSLQSSCNIYEELYRRLNLGNACCHSFVYSFIRQWLYSPCKDLGRLTSEVS
jgi:hypothetical protein